MQTTGYEHATGCYEQYENDTNHTYIITLQAKYQNSHLCYDAHCTHCRVDV